MYYINVEIVRIVFRNFIINERSINLRGFRIYIMV